MELNTSKNNQKQIAGDESIQLQANVIENVQIQGLTERRVNEIVDAKFSEAISTCVLESKLVAEQRVNELKDNLITKLMAKPGLTNALKEPACVDDLKSAAKSAAKSDEPRDREILSELLVKRFENVGNRNIATGITKAIEIVDYLTEDELNALTVCYAITQYRPLTESIKEGITALDRIFAKLPSDSLPEGGNWIDSLDVHSAVRYSELSSIKPLSEFYFDNLSGYTVRGLPEESDEEKLARDLLRDNDIPDEALVAHELNPGFKRLITPVHKAFDRVEITRIINGTICSFKLSEEQITALEKIAESSVGEESNQIIKDNLKEMIGSFPHLSAVEKWWNALPTAPHLTIVGKSLANANARRIEPSLPDIE